MSMVETKVVAATAGGGIGAALSTFTLWLLGVYVWGASSSADAAEKAVAAVPTPVSALVLIVLSAAVAFAAGYLAPHTHRPPPIQLGPPIPVVGGGFASGEAAPPEQSGR